MNVPHCHRFLDFSLLLVFGGAVVASTIVYQFFITFKKMEKPLMAEKFHLPKKTEVDRALVVNIVVINPNIQ